MEKRPKKSGFDELSHAINPNWKIYVDTCSLYKAMEPESVFWDEFEKALQSHGCKFTITAATFNEMKKHKHNPDHPASSCAAELEKKLREFGKARKNLMLLAGDLDEEFHDNAIVAIVKDRSRKFNQAYITNDMANAWDVYNVIHGGISSNSGKLLLIFKIGKGGELVRYQELPFLSELRPDEVRTFFDMRKAAGHEKDAKKKRELFEAADDFLAEHSSFRSTQSNRQERSSSKGKTKKNHPVENEDMSRRVQELANDYGMTPEEMLVRVGELGICGKNVASMLTAQQVQLVKESFEQSIGRTNAVQEFKPLDELDEPVVVARVNPNYSLPSPGDQLKGICGQDVVSLTLVSRIAKGGEGFVYTIQSSELSGRWLAKIYKKSKLYKTMDHAKQRRDKVEFIVENRIERKNVPGSNSNLKMGRPVKFPSYVLVDEEDSFVGYLMKEGAGVALSTLIADGSIESEFRRKYPKIQKTDLIEICINFLLAIKALHARGIIVGDLNVGNILADTDTNLVTLIDADSYQYGNRYPCDVGVEQYTSPEFLKDHSNLYRTVENELFVVARILCQILMLIDNPYKSKVAKDPVKDMINGEFRFTFDFFDGSRMDNSEAPDEDLEIRWGQLTKKLKDSFGNTFHHDGRYWSPEARLDEDFWIEALKEYKADIEDSVKAGNGFVSNDAFPSTRRAWVFPFKCTECGKRGVQDGNLFLPVTRFSPTYDDINDIARHICFSCYCQKIGVVESTCAECGEPIMAKDNGRNQYCQSCFIKYQTTVECSICGKEMIAQIWDRDRKTFICEDCREKKTCVTCGRPFPKYKLDEMGRCPNCHLVNVSCSKCGKTQEVKPRDAHSTYICSDCREKASCPECGKKFASWILSANGGKCPNCKDLKNLVCVKCGKTYRGKDQRSKNKDNICSECWTQVSCRICGTRYCANGTTPLAKWMVADQDGLCRSCYRDAHRKQATGQNSVGLPEKQKNGISSSTQSNAPSAESQSGVKRLMKNLFGW